METIKTTIQNVMQSWQEKKQQAGGLDPEQMLKKIFSKKERQHAKFNYLRRGTLGITVDSSTWLYHLNLKKGNLLAHLAKDAPKIKDIRFRLGERG